VNHDEARDWFGGYIDAFNRSDFEALRVYYAPNVRFEGQAGTFDSADEVIAFYRGVKRRMNETLVVHSLVAGECDLAVELETTLQALEDWPDFPTGPIVKGQVLRRLSFIFYEIEAGRFTRIRSARFKILDGAA
jgi:hypothetical protein